MSDWWQHISALNQLFYAAAAFFSVFFVWQLVAALVGLGGDDAGHDADVGAADHGGFDHADAGHTDHDGDAAETTVAFKLLSIRSIVTFCTLFSWGGALYLNGGSSPAWAVSLAVLWGLAGMAGVAGLFYFMRRMTETGNVSLDSCVGTDGTVYVQIPDGGVGEVRVAVSGLVSYVKARAADGRAIAAGTPIRVVRRIGQTLVEVIQE